jgi:hypothetical protein
LIENDWSRWCFNEGFNSDWQNRLLTLEFLNGVNYETWLPQSQTPIKLITPGPEPNEISIEFDEVICSNPQSIIPIWTNFGGSVTIVGTRI